MEPTEKMFRLTGAASTASVEERLYFQRSLPLADKIRHARRLAQLGGRDKQVTEALSSIVDESYSHYEPSRLEVPRNVYRPLSFATDCAAAFAFFRGDNQDRSTYYFRILREKNNRDEILLVCFMLKIFRGTSALVTTCVAMLYDLYLQNYHDEIVKLAALDAVETLLPFCEPDFLKKQALAIAGKSIPTDEIQLRYLMKAFHAWAERSGKTDLSMLTDIVLVSSLDAYYQQYMIDALVEYKNHAALLRALEQTVRTEMSTYFGRFVRLENNLVCNTFIESSGDAIISNLKTLRYGNMRPVTTSEIFDAVDRTRQPSVVPLRTVLLNLLTDGLGKNPPVGLLRAMTLLHMTVYIIKRNDECKSLDESTANNHMSAALAASNPAACVKDFEFPSTFFHVLECYADKPEKHEEVLKLLPHMLGSKLYHTPGAYESGVKVFRKIVPQCSPDEIASLVTTVMKDHAIKENNAPVDALVYDAFTLMPFLTEKQQHELVEELAPWTAAQTITSCAVACMMPQPAQRPASPGKPDMK